MWAVALRNDSSFDAMKQAFDSEAKYKVVTTGTGGTVAEAAKGSNLPHLFLVSDDLAQTKNVLSWLHSNLHPTVIVSSDSSPDCGNGDTQPIPYFCPWTCLRAAGRTDPGGAPVLYEEIHFDSATQKLLVGATEVKELDDQHFLFGSNRSKHRANECEWLFHHLKCRSWDNFTAELLLAGKRLGFKVGCFKVLEKESPELFAGRLVKGWRRVIELL